VAKDSCDLTLVGGVHHPCFVAWLAAHIKTGMCDLHASTSQPEQLAAVLLHGEYSLTLLMLSHISLGALLSLWLCRVCWQLFCKGGQRKAQALAFSRVDLKQCGNAAFGECQRLAKNKFQSPCGFAFNGFDQCKRDDFQSFYNGERLLSICM
jgi:hypothetical protein